MTNSERIHPALIARTAIGVILLLWPERILDAVGRDRTDRRWLLAARILGARHLLEAVVANIEPKPAFAAGGAAVDAIHACTAGGLAVFDSKRRRVLLTNAAAAAAFTLAGTHHARVLARKS